MKPKTIEVGKCYRMRRFADFGCREPGPVVVYVKSIDGRKQRLVHIEPVGPSPGWTCDYYGAFLRRVHSEVPVARN